MRIAELLDILRDYPQEWEVELAVIAPVEDESPEITVDRYSIEGVLPVGGRRERREAAVAGRRRGRQRRRLPRRARHRGLTGVPPWNRPGTSRRGCASSSTFPTPAWPRSAIDRS